jgi:hypothetical protein
MDDEKPILEYDHVPRKRSRSMLEIIVVVVAVVMLVGTTVIILIAMN